MTELLLALDEARHTCQGLTDRHIVGVPTGLARTLLDAANCEAAELRRKLRNRGSSRVIWTTAGELLTVVAELEERYDAAT
ncbi:hypothetical protein Pan44_42250 [Caulifigura coniformis]|uniref:Uncharacterized protein n=1 Tax=Caulifigura coniformis TaxID=2527983 RepID=A0A517SJ62_9PLAN|nr:hypothetical protein [Caulifigura coniformis]QDT56173.1 hypothetical protein Pan44_42250 [Caulifigura coniformis]